MTGDDKTRFDELMALEFPDGLVPSERARSKLDAPTPRPEESAAEPEDGFRT